MCKENSTVEMPLFDIIKSVHDRNNNGQLLLLQKFRQAIKSFSYKLNYDGADTDLTIFILELCQSINISRIEKLHEGAIVKYIYNALRHEYIRLSKANSILLYSWFLFR